MENYHFKVLCVKCEKEHEKTLYKTRQYQCVDCGNIINTKTNHIMDIYPTCTGKCRQIINPHTEKEVVLQRQTTHKYIGV